MKNIYNIIYKGIYIYIHTYDIQINNILIFLDMICNLNVQFKIECQKKTYDIMELYRDRPKFLKNLR